MEALAELVRRHQGRALRLAYRSLGDWQLAEDVVQESFLRINRAASKYRPDARFSTWFYRIVVNLCLDELRRRQRRAEAATNAAPEVADTGESPAHREELTELHQAVRHALDQLSERERLAVILHRFEGQSHRQIARDHRRQRLGRRVLAGTGLPQAAPGVGPVRGRFRRKFAGQGRTGRLTM